MVYHVINRSAELDNMCMNEQQYQPIDVDLYIPQTDQSIIMLLLFFGVGV